MVVVILAVACVAAMAAATVALRSARREEARRAAMRRHPCIRPIPQRPTGPDDDPALLAEIARRAAESRSRGTD